MYLGCLLWAIVLVSNLRFFFFLAYFRSEGCFPRHTFCIYTEVCAPNFRVLLAARLRAKVSPVLYRWPTAPASCIEKATIELTLNQPKTQLGIMYRLCVLSLICMSLQDTINTTVWIMAAREEVRIWPEWLQPLLAFVGFFGLLWSPYFPSELQNEVNMHMCSSSRRPVGMFPQLC